MSEPATSGPSYNRPQSILTPLHTVALLRSPSANTERDPDHRPRITRIASCLHRSPQLRVGALTSLPGRDDPPHMDSIPRISRININDIQPLGRTRITAHKPIIHRQTTAMQTRSPR